MEYDENTGGANGFHIQNPNGSKLYIDVSDYSRQSETDPSANKLKNYVHESFKFLAENVPATTPIFESIERDYPKGMSFQQANKYGLWNKTPGKNENELDPKTNPVVIIGDISLPRGQSPITSGGGGVAANTEAQNFLGTDGLWHNHSSPEAVLHELVHSVKSLQNMMSAKDAQIQSEMAGEEMPIDNMKIAIRIENEERAFSLVNKVLAEPLGRAEQAPGSYGTYRPAYTRILKAEEYSTADLEALRNTPIPSELHEFSQPKAIPMLQQNQLAPVSQLTPEQQKYEVGVQLASLTLQQQEILKQHPEHKAAIEAFQHNQPNNNLDLEHERSI
jgi:hypothetical protein